MKETYSKAPWHVQGTLIVTDDGTMVAQAVKQADLRLIAAAPRLLAALKSIANWDSHSVKLAVNFGSNGVRDNYRSIARAAIAEAEGDK